MSRFFALCALVTLACTTPAPKAPSLLAGTQCTLPDSGPDAIVPTRVDGPTAKLLVSQGARLVDVRAPDFYARGHIAGAINVPVAQIADRAAELGPPGTPVVLYCRTGAGSTAAAQTLVRLGYTRVYNLGSYLNWGEGAPPATPLPTL
jgi:phage shock protein E